MIKILILLNGLPKKLDENFYYSDRNNQLFVEEMVKEARALAKGVNFRALTEENSVQVCELDRLSGNYLEQGLDSEDYGWGLFKDNELIGYCSIGYADDCGKGIEDYEGWTSDSLLLSDVFIKSEYRHQGYGSFMVDEAIKHRTENEKELVFLTVLNDKLYDFYEKIGFSVVGDGVMVRDERIGPDRADLNERIKEEEAQRINSKVALDEQIEFASGRAAGSGFSPNEKAQER